MRWLLLIGWYFLVGCCDWMSRSNGVYGVTNNDNNNENDDFVVSLSLEEEYNALHFSPDNMYGSPYGGYARATRSRLASLPLRLTTESTDDSYYTYRDGMGRLFACHLYPEQQLSSTSIHQSMFAPAIEKQAQDEEQTTLDTTTTTTTTTIEEEEVEPQVELTEEEEEEKEKRDQRIHNKKAMRKLKGLCSQIHMGWWSYEWCHQSSVTQFHVHIDKDEYKVESMTNLGDYNSRTVDEDSVQDHFINGDWCEEANTYRSTIVEFVCCDPEEERNYSVQFHNQLSKQEEQQREHIAIIQQLDETKTCQYHLKICTDTLCPQPPTMESKILTPPFSKDSSIRDILKIALGSQFCLYKSLGWWKYEFCYENHVRQYHETTRINEATHVMMVSKESDQEHYLGYHDDLILDGFPKEKEVFFLSSSSISQPNEPPTQFTQEQLDIIEKVKSMKIESSSSSDKAAMMEDEDGSTSNTMYIQEYTNGEVCEHPDVTDSIMKGNLSGSVERSTTIRYSCGSILEIQKVQEDTSCHYVLDITVPELCHHHYFQTPHVETNVVKCIPIDPKTLTTLQEEEEEQQL